MEQALPILSIIFFYISFGNINEYIKEFHSYNEHVPKAGQFLYIIIALLCVILSFSIITNVVDVKWYWDIILFVINVILIYILGGLFGYLYRFLVGYKTKPQISLTAGRFVRKPLPVVDAIISFVIAIVLLKMV
ncbi:hypothetical protein OBK28_13290 [Empedobacter falsenii]|uniref:DUF3995 domain-containing protein n=1 Tax=Empedobacter falsenii TaxID=343874 RepID=A0ABY8V5V0_9FLAO|nr:hypothetical protein [Empedobacter falsenii]WIH96547.1 hypothetical protein OBA43_09735 [Empedobacter falsenii]